MKAIYMGITKRPKSDVDARVFHLNPPLEGNEYVLVSATTMKKMKEYAIQHMDMDPAYLDDIYVPETLIFACDAAGDVETWMDLPGSYKGGTSHAQALRNAGYEIVGEKNR